LADAAAVQLSRTPDNACKVGLSASSAEVSENPVLRQPIATTIRELFELETSNLESKSATAQLAR
jgi:hypothetical protein